MSSALLPPVLPLFVTCRAPPAPSVRLTSLNHRSFCRQACALCLSSRATGFLKKNVSCFRRIKTASGAPCAVTSWPSPVPDSRKRSDRGARSDGCRTEVPRTPTGLPRGIPRARLGQPDRRPARTASCARHHGPLRIRAAPPSAARGSHPPRPFRKPSKPNRSSQTRTVGHRDPSPAPPWRWHPTQVLVPRTIPARDTGGFRRLTRAALLCLNLRTVGETP